MIKKACSGSLLVAVLLLATAGVRAAGGNGGIRLGETRIVFDGSNNVATMKVTNTSETDVWLMHLWVSPYGEVSDDAKAKNKSDIPFMVTPPLYRLEPTTAAEFRINQLADNLPADRESVFYVNSLAIPPKTSAKNYQKAVQSGLQFAMNTRIKLFYRPVAINDSAAVKGAPAKLTVTMSGKTLIVKNPTPWFVTMNKLFLNGKPITTNKDTMVAPFSQFSLPIPIQHGTFSFQTIDDRGMTTPKIDKTF